jgi:REP element-mobilizing transposase RayT
VPSLRSGRVIREVERSFGVACEQRSFRVVHYSIQRDHVHLLVEADGPAALARGMKSIGARIARAERRRFSPCRAPTAVRRARYFPAIGPTIFSANSSTVSWRPPWIT